MVIDISHNSIKRILEDLGVYVGDAFNTEVEGKPAVGLIKNGHVERVTAARLAQEDPEYRSYLMRNWGNNFYEEDQMRGA